MNINKNNQDPNISWKIFILYLSICIPWNGKKVKVKRFYANINQRRARMAILTLDKIGLKSKSVARETKKNIT